MGDLSKHMLLQLRLKYLNDDIKADPLQKNRGELYSFLLEQWQKLHKSSRYLDDRIFCESSKSSMNLSSEVKDKLVKKKDASGGKVNSSKKRKYKQSVKKERSKKVRKHRAGN